MTAFQSRKLASGGLIRPMAVHRSGSRFNEVMYVCVCMEEMEQFKKLWEI
jgi:hypothetical protein